MTTPEKETSLKILAFYFACFSHYLSETVIFGNVNVQAFGVEEFPMIGYVLGLTIQSIQLRIFPSFSCIYPICKISYCNNCMAFVSFFYEGSAKR
jgi:hypothetical protein